MNFTNAMKNELNETGNVALTENGAMSYRTTTSHVLDMNFAISSLRNKTDLQIEQMFAQVFYEDKVTACKFLFYIRDIVSGAGERRTFRICMKWLAKNETQFAKVLLPFICTDMCRFDDAFVLLDTPIKDDVVLMIKKQLTSDMNQLNSTDKASISLLAKWMPSLTASSAITKRYATIICKGLKMTPRNYRKMLSALRNHLRVVERDMSAKHWGDINYSTVPSKANLLYNNAFLRNDESRRRAFLESLKNGDKSVKINAGTLFPHDIVNKYTTSTYYARLHNYDETLEQLWKNLKDTVGGASNIMVVSDSSGSMSSRIDSKSSISAMDVATALSIYFSERCSGQFKDNYITFSSRPQWVDLSNCKTLHDKLAKAYGYNIVEDTNIEKTFDLILNTAVVNHMTQEDLPNTVLIISDMEFNCACTGNVNAKLFQVINSKFVNAGYQMPKLVFWNVNSRSGAIPVKASGNGFPCALVSGFSTNTVKMVLNGELDPLNALMTELNSKRYSAIGDAIANLV